MFLFNGAKRMATSPQGRQFGKDFIQGLGEDELKDRLGTNVQTPPSAGGAAATILRKGVVKTFGDKPKPHTNKEFVSEMRHKGMTTEDSVASIKGDTLGVSNKALQGLQNKFPKKSLDVSAIQRDNVSRQFRSEQKQLFATVTPPPAEISAFEQMANADMFKKHNKE